MMILLKINTKYGLSNCYNNLEIIVKVYVKLYTTKEYLLFLREH